MTDSATNQRTHLPIGKPGDDDAAQLRQAVLGRTQTVVVKVGTNVLSRENDQLDTDRIAKLARELVSIRQSGRRVVLVSSGAVGAGLGVMGIDERPTELPKLQAAAALGQAQLIRYYDESLRPFGLHAAQLLLTRNDFRDRRRYLNVRNTLSALGQLPCIPIVNENDTVSVHEIRVGDNDRLASLVASLLPSSLLILLTTADGLLDGPPDEPSSERIPIVTEWTDEIRSFATADRTRRGTGGMRSKLDSVRMATSVGETVLIADGRRDGVLAAIISGEDVGTMFLADEQTMPAYKRWIAQAVLPTGRLHLNDGAYDAVVNDGRSLLAVGVDSIDGRFARGDVVSLLHRGNEFARGAINYDDREAVPILGKRSSEFEAVLGECPYRELIHRDNLVLLT